MFCRLSYLDGSEPNYFAGFTRLLELIMGFQFGTQRTPKITTRPVTPPLNMLPTTGSVTTVVLSEVYLRAIVNSSIRAGVCPKDI